MTHIADRAGFLAALSLDDPERRTAEEHIQSCAKCRDAFEEGRRLSRLLAEAAPTPVLSALSLERAKVAIEIESRNERRASRILVVATVAAVFSAWGLQILVGSGLARDLRSLSLSLGVLAAALAGAMLARFHQRLVVAALVLLAGLFAFFVGSVMQLAPRVGVMCAVYEVLAGALVWFAVRRALRVGEATLDAWQGAAIAAAGALSSGAAQHLTCPASHAGPHLFVFHFGGIVLAAMLGAGGALLMPA